MKIIKSLFIAAFLVVLTPMTAQTADEIINTYFENTGGADAWNNLEGIHINASVDAGGMTIPVDIFQMKDGRQLVKINLQGQEITQVAFDGETMWGTNMMTGVSEKATAEDAENMKKQMGDFPSPFLNYKDKGYTVEYMGKETKEGTETFKLKLTQKPIMTDGVETPLITYHYFETENYVPIASESEIPIGPQKGQMSTNTMSDYQEVGGLYFPFDMGMAGQTLKVKEIILNPEIDQAEFVFPVKE